MALGEASPGLRFHYLYLAVEHFSLHKNPLGEEKKKESIKKTSFLCKFLVAAGHTGSL